MKKYYWCAGLFNFVLGGMFFFVLFLWVMSFIYVAEIMGWIPDPTLDEGLLPVFLFLSFAASLIYFPILIITNITIWKKVNLNKLQYLFLAVATLIVGFLSFFSIIYLR